MKYNININQLVLAKTNLNLIDCAILDYLIFYCNSKSPKIEKNRVDGYTWVNYDCLLKDMPLLGIKRNGALTPRIKKIADEGFIKTKIIRINGHKRLFVDLTKLTDSLFIEMNKPIHENDVVLFTKTKKPIHETVVNNNTIYNNTKDNNISKDIGNKVSKGREDINILLEKIKQLVGVIDGTKLEQRRYAKNFLDSKTPEILKASGIESPTGQQIINATLRIFQLAKQDSFHRKWSNSMGYVYKKAGSIVMSQQNNKPKIAQIPKDIMDVLTQC